MVYNEKKIPSYDLYKSLPHGPAGARGRRRQGIWRGVARLSLRLVSAMWSVVSFVIATFCAIGSACGLIAHSAVSFFFLALRSALGLFAVAAVSRRQ